MVMDLKERVRLIRQNARAHLIIAGNAKDPKISADAWDRWQELMDEAEDLRTGRKKDSDGND